MIEGKPSISTVVAMLYVGLTGILTGLLSGTPAVTTWGTLIVWGGVVGAYLLLRGGAE